MAANTRPGRASTDQGKDPTEAVPNLRLLLEQELAGRAHHPDPRCEHNAGLSREASNHSHAEEGDQESGEEWDLRRDDRKDSRPEERRTRIDATDPSHPRPRTAAPHRQRRLRRGV